jgi:ring-1,2-phenylacetyl-CoA epoxidase subunit PaaC
MTSLKSDLREPLVQLLFSVADDKFFLGHRNADWTGLAPILEEDIAFSSLAQDEIAHASALYHFIAGLCDTKADKLAFGRKPNQYRCATIVELSDEFDWALALCRNFFCDHFDVIRLGRLAESSYQPLRQLAVRLAAEEQIHVQHSDSWLVRLGQGADDAKSRMQDALNRLAELAPMLWEPTVGLALLEKEGIYPGDSRSWEEQWMQTVGRVATQAGLGLQLKRVNQKAKGGRHGVHEPGFAATLDELTEVYRLEPEAAW